MFWLYGITAFLSAFLLFQVELIMARYLLPSAHYFSAGTNPPGGSKSIGVNLGSPFAFTRLRVESTRSERVAPDNDTEYSIDGYAVLFVEGMGTLPGKSGEGVLVRLIGLHEGGGIEITGDEVGPCAIPVGFIRIPPSD